ncbi:MAG: leucine-rich repeat domain-containing protein, partial [Muribaculaceae bacterium]|nr:leucine-rich repeat domain-containing protein [Muribaculaceae bacterium]
MRIPKLFSILLALVYATTALAAGEDDLRAPNSVAIPLRPPGKAEAVGYREADSTLVIPASVTALPPFCLAGCEGLKRVEFAPGSRCRGIGEYCFAECIDLEEIILPVSLAELGEGVFRECRALKRLNLPAGITRLPKEMCHRCIALEEIALPASLREISSFALAGCEALRELNIPAGVTKIGSNAFSLCRSITEAVVPAGVISLESYAFAGCESLRRLTLPKRQDMLGELIVADCPSLVEIMEPAAVPPVFDCMSFLFEPDDLTAYNRCT